MDLSLTHPDRRHLTDDWVLIHNHFSNFHFLFSNGRYEHVSQLKLGPSLASISEPKQYKSNYIIYLLT